MKFGQLLTYYRQRAGLNKSQLADEIGIKSTYIIGLEKGRVRPPPLERLEQISKIFNLSDIEKNKFLKVAFEERQNDDDLAFQEAIKENKILESFKSSGTRVEHVAIDNKPIISWTALYKRSNLTSFHKQEEADMLRVRVENVENAPIFEKGDELTLDCSLTELENDKFFLFRDGQVKRVILRQIKLFGESIILRTTNLKVEEQFDSKRFEVIGKVIHHSRSLI